MVYIQLVPVKSTNTGTKDVPIATYIPVLVNFNNINPNNQDPEPNPTIPASDASDPVDELEDLFDISTNNNTNVL
jgi:hypothetical protein